MTSGQITPNMRAMGDHFCHLDPSLELRQVELALDRVFVSYETGEPVKRRTRLARLECRS